MVQIYFLSVLANLFGGSLLAADFLGQKSKGLAFLIDLSAKKNAKIVVGGLSVLIGLLNLIFKSPGEVVPVAGDLVPSLSALAIGLFLLFDLSRPAGDSSSDEELEKSSGSTSIANIGTKLQPYRVPMGITGLVVSIVHFILPGVLLL